MLCSDRKYFTINNVDADNEGIYFVQVIIKDKSRQKLVKLIVTMSSLWRNQLLNHLMEINELI